MSAPVRLFRVTPGAHTLRELLTPLLAAPGETRLTAFDSSRLTLCRDLFAHLRNVEICEFGQAVGVVIAERMGHAPVLPPRGLIVSALAEACRDLDEDSPFYKARSFAGFHRVLARNWETLRSYKVDLPVVEPPALRAKTEALAAIYSRAEQLLNQLGRKFNADAMAACPDMEPEPPPFQRLVLVAGSEYRPAEFDWLEWLAESGVGVDIICEQHATREATGNLFGSTVSTGGLFTESERIEARFGPSLPYSRANPLADCVFSETSAGAIFDCEILETPDVLSECEWVLRRAHECAATNAGPDRDYASVAIFCRSLDSYGPILQSAADRLGIPLSISRRFPVIATSVARTVLAVLRACASSDVRDLTRLARSSYLQTGSLETRKALDQACRDAYRQGSQAWDGITEWSRAEGTPAPAWLRELLGWREAAVAERLTVEGWREKLIQLSLLPSFSELSAEGEPFEDPIRRRIQSRDQHAITAMLRSLAYDASIDRISSRRQLGLAEFLRLARRLWEHEEVTLEPLDGGIQVVSTAIAIKPVETLFVMGMLEGEFPRRRTEDVLFTDEDLGLISSNEPIPNSVAVAEAERDEFYRACCAPARTLILTYPRVDDERDNVPAFYLEEIKRVAGIADPHRYSRAEFVPRQPELTPDRELAAALSEPTGWPPAPSVLSPRAQALARGSARAFEPRELADAYECPFRYFARYRLEMRPSHQRMRWGSLSSIPVLVHLSEIGDAATAEAALRSAVDEQLGNLIGDTLPHDYRLMRAGANRLIADWISREFQARATWPRDSLSSHNVGFQDGPLRSKLKLRDGRTVDLTGSVPAVSRRGDLEVVHLFKGRDPVVDAGAEGESRLHPSDQLEIALYLLMRTQRDQAAGVEIDHANGRRLISLGAASFPRQDIKVEMRTTSFEGHERSELLHAMVDRLEIAVDRIESGDISPKPDEARCHTCDFGELCRRSYRFSEVDDDPFAFDEEMNGIHPD